MESQVNPVNRAVVQIFGNPTAALWISALLLIWCAFIIIRNYLRFHRPQTAALKQRMVEITALRAAGRSTVPSPLSEELAANPFMRAPDVAALGKIRTAKDSF